MSEPGMIGYSYFSSAFTYSNGKLAEDMRHTLTGVKYDTIIGTGLSGTVFTARVAPALKKVFAILRKEDDESTHSGNRMEGRIGDAWVFADDFTETGATLLRVLKYMQKRHPGCEFKGMYSYERGIFRDPEELREHLYHNKELCDTLVGPLYGPRKALMFEDPLTEPVDGWSLEMKALLPVPEDVEISYDNRQGQPTFWSRSARKTYDPAEYPQFKELAQRVLKAREQGLYFFDVYYRRWSDMYEKMTTIDEALKRFELFNKVMDGGPRPADPLPEWDVATGEIIPASQWRARPATETINLTRVPKDQPGVFW